MQFEIKTTTTTTGHFCGLIPTKIDSDIPPWHEVDVAFLWCMLERVLSYKSCFIICSQNSWYRPFRFSIVAKIDRVIPLVNVKYEFYMCIGVTLTCYTSHGVRRWGWPWNRN